MKKTAVKFKSYGSREISSADWNKVGVPDQGKVVWSPDNENIVTSDELKPQAIEYLKTQPEFEVSEFESTEEKGNK